MIRMIPSRCEVYIPLCTYRNSNLNEPFITSGVFWWSIPLLFPFIYKNSNAYESDNKI